MTFLSWKMIDLPDSNNPDGRSFQWFFLFIRYSSHQHFLWFSCINLHENLFELHHPILSRRTNMHLHSISTQCRSTAFTGIKSVVKISEKNFLSSYSHCVNDDLPCILSTSQSIAEMSSASKSKLSYPHQNWKKGHAESNPDVICPTEQFRTRPSLNIFRVSLMIRIVGEKWKSS